MADTFIATVSRVAGRGAFAVNPHRRNSAIARAAASYSEPAACRMIEIRTALHLLCEIHYCKSLLYLGTAIAVAEVAEPRKCYFRVSYASEMTEVEL